MKLGSKGVKRSLLFAYRLRFTSGTKLSKYDWLQVDRDDHKDIFMNGRLWSNALYNFSFRVFFTCICQIVMEFCDGL